MENLKLLRKQSGNTQIEMSKIFHLSLRGYQDIENGKNETSYANLIKFADYFGCSVDYLLGHTANADLTPNQQQLITLIKLLDRSKVDFLIGWCSNALGLPYDSSKPVAPWN